MTGMMFADAQDRSSTVVGYSEEIERAPAVPKGWLVYGRSERHARSQEAVRPCVGGS